MRRAVIEPFINFDKLYEVVVITDWVYKEPIIDTTQENSQQVVENVSVEETSVNLEE